MNHFLEKAAILLFRHRSRALVGTQHGGWRLCSFLGSGSYGASFRAESAEGAHAVLKLVRKPQSKQSARSFLAWMDAQERERTPSRPCPGSAARAHPPAEDRQDACDARAHDRRAEAGTLPPRADVWTECAALQRCEGSPLIPRWLGIVNEGGRYFIVLDHLAGESLQSLLGSRKRFTEQELAIVAHDVTAALAHAHARGVAHNDLRPANVLFDGRRAALIDFGLATFFPPEQGKADFPDSSANDRSGLADVLLYLLYTRYDGPRTKRSWHEELDLSRCQQDLLEALFADRPPFGGWSEVQRAVERAFTIAPRGTKPLTRDAPTG